MDELIGRALDDKYWPESLLGKGGMGAVYLATHIHTRRRVAVKVIAPQYMGDREFVVRFQREAEAAGRLRHPNVVNVTDFGVADVNGVQVAYLVMEYMDGQSLSDYLRVQPQMPFSLIVEVIDQMALAIDEAHRLGIVHRDLKPDNIWLESNRRGGYNVKVLDFGIAKLSDAYATEPVSQLATTTATPVKVASTAADEAATQEIVLTSPPKSMTLADSSGFSTTVGTVLGTPAYMSPEQCRGESAEGASDIYSMGIIAYQLITGELPFDGRGLELVRQHSEETPRTPRQRDPRISQGISTVVMSSLEKQPERRPHTATAFAKALRINVDGPRALLQASKQSTARTPGLFLIVVATAVPFALLLAAFSPYVPWWVTLAYQIFVAPLILALVSGGAAVAHRQALESPEAPPEIGPLFKQYLRIFPALLFTQLCWLVQPWRWLSGALTAPVLVHENLRRQAALDRSAKLTQPFLGLAREIIVRLFAIGLLGSMYFPAIVSTLGAPLDAVKRFYLFSFPSNFAFAMLPASFNMMFLAYAAGLSTLYEWSRSAFAEPLAVVANSQATPNSRMVKPSIAVRWWALAPILLIAWIVFGQFRLWVGSQTSELAQAATEGRMHAVRKAVASGIPSATVNLPVRNKRTILMYAADWGDAETARMLLDAGAQVDLQDSAGNTALHRAVHARATEVVRLLLARSANPNLRDDDGVTPLVVAVRSSQREAVKLLLQAGAKTDIKDDQGKTASDYAKEEGNSSQLLP